MPNNYEDSFIEALQKHDPRLETPAEPEALLSFLHEKSKHRWRVYADGYALRITEALSENILDLASALYGQGFLKQLIFDYISAKPPSAAVMPDLLAGFADFLDGHPSRELSPDLSAFVALAYQRWQVLIGEDPVELDPSVFADEQSVTALTLQANHGFMESAFPLYSLWCEAERRSKNPEYAALVPMRAEAVLHFKSSPVVHEMLLIDPPLVPFVRALASGKTLGEAMEDLDIETPEAEQAFVALMGKLREASAFVKSS